MTPSSADDRFDVILNAAGRNKIAVIKAVREFTDLGLKDSMDLVESVPCVVKGEVLRDEAEMMARAIERAGGQVALEPVGSGEEAEAPASETDAAIARWGESKGALFVEFEKFFGPESTYPRA